MESQTYLTSLYGHVTITSLHLYLRETRQVSVNKVSQLGKTQYYAELIRKNIECKTLGEMPSLFNLLVRLHPENTVLVLVPHLQEGQ